MEKVIKELEELRDKAISELKKGNQEALEIKLEIDRAILCLRFCDEHKLFNNLKEKYEVIELPFPSGSGGFSEYRIIDDCETEERKYWKVLEENGEEVALFPLDIVIKNRTL